jgi:TatD DNase family protein
MMLVDTHCHLDFQSFDEDRDAVVERAAQAMVGTIIVPSVDLESVQAVLEVAETYSGAYAAVGVHPNFCAGWRPEWLEAIRRRAGHPKVVAVGEIGLDYYRDRAPARTQRRALEAQLDLALELELPVILHNREADHDLLEILSGAALSRRSGPGVLHSFSSGWDTARRALDLGYYLGFTGPVTYPKAAELRKVVAQAPLDRILVETDAPFLAPQARRGRRNEPAYVNYVLERVAEIHGLSTEEAARQTTDNVRRLFGERLSL